MDRRSLNCRPVDRESPNHRSFVSSHWRLAIGDWRLPIADRRIVDWRLGIDGLSIVELIVDCRIDRRTLNCRSVDRQSINRRSVDRQSINRRSVDRQSPIVNRQSDAPSSPAAARHGGAAGGGRGGLAAGDGPFAAARGRGLSRRRLASFGATGASRGGRCRGRGLGTWTGVFNGARRGLVARTIGRIHRRAFSAESVHGDFGPRRRGTGLVVRMHALYGCGGGDARRRVRIRFAIVARWRNAAVRGRPGVRAAARHVRNGSRVCCRRR